MLQNFLEDNRTKQTGFANAQKSMDKMFGKNIVSGNSFKNTYGKPLNNKPKGMITKIKKSNKFRQAIKTNLKDNKTKKFAKSVGNNFANMFK